MIRSWNRVSCWALLTLATGSLVPVPALGQVTNENWLQQVDQGETVQDRITAIRALGVAVIQQAATDDERKRILELFQKIAADPDPVIRLAANAEMLKLSAAENSVPLSEFAMRGMGDDNINVRRGLIKFFRAYFAGRMELGKSHQPQLMRLLKSEDLETRYHAAATLHAWNISDPTIIEILIDSLDLQNYRAASVYSLVRDRQSRTLTIEKLFERLRQSNHNAGVYINLLSLLTPESSGFVDDIIPFFENDSESVRAAVVDALPRMKTDDNRKAIDLLVRAVDDPSSLIRRLVLGSMIQLEPNPDVFRDSMVKLLKDADEQVGVAASDSFSFFENRFEQLLPEISDIFAGSNSGHIIAALNGCMTAGPLAESASPGIIKLIRHENSDVRVRAIWALHEIKIDRDTAISSLNELLSAETNAEVISEALNTLELLEPTDDSSRELFLKYLDDPDQFVRLSCVNGLGNFALPAITKRLLRVAKSPDDMAGSQLSQLDQAVIDAVAKTGAEGVAIAIEHLADADTTTRVRAIRIVGQSNTVDPSVRERIVSGLDADSPAAVRLAAATAASRFSDPEPELLKRIFQVSSPHDRQITIQILGLLANMGQQAAPVAADIAALLNGGYRNRFANEAKQALVALGPHAAPALPVLLEGNLTLQKLDCIAAIGPAASAVADRLKSLIEEQTQAIDAARSLPAITLCRRIRLSAAMALWSVTSATDLTAQIVRAELKTDIKPLAIAAIAKLAHADPTLVSDLIALLPDRDAIIGLGSIGAHGKPATESLRSIADGSDAEIAYLAKKALWQIEDDPQLAVDTVTQIIRDNRFQSVEIRTEDRQKVWETLRYLATKQRSHPPARQLLQEIQRGRFPNLREFVRQLPAG